MLLLLLPSSPTPISYDNQLRLPVTFVCNKDGFFDHDIPTHQHQHVHHHANCITSSDACLGNVSNFSQPTEPSYHWQFFLPST
ncbi:hypothetical protein Cob_v004666 [Colletotrichum orbiculare MAFF 240422]|uniref:Uncharacterized protein n=1 Tax=Colletotrichum orbiculare (strain 104-T / ATCC 96160 / CBS 514.97 / LARS 414 / MAFF 240422) TaxID=1213857 RepID=A0A484FYL5_COLOR|nr:hypothetical protein Cob_v004666 [Colletotrichum orbiculare MAFF 240422]